MLSSSICAVPSATLERFVQPDGIVRFMRQSARRAIAWVFVQGRIVGVTGVPTSRCVSLYADSPHLALIVSVAQRAQGGISWVRYPDATPCHEPVLVGADVFEPFVSHNGVDVFSDFFATKFSLVVQNDDYGCFPRYALPRFRHAGIGWGSFTLEKIDPVLRERPEMAPPRDDDWWDGSPGFIEFAKMRLRLAIDAGVLQTGGRVDPSRSRLDLWPDAQMHRERRQCENRARERDMLLLEPYRARKTRRSNESEGEPLDDYVSEVFGEDFIIADRARSVSRQVVEAAQAAMERERERRQSRSLDPDGYPDPWDPDSRWSLNVYEDGESDCDRFVITGSDGEWSDAIGGDGRCTPIYVRCGVPIEGSSYHTMSTYRCERHGVSTLAI